MRDRALDLLAASAGQGADRSRVARRPVRHACVDDLDVYDATTTHHDPRHAIDALTALESAGFLSVTDGDASEFADVPGPRRPTCS